MVLLINFAAVVTVLITLFQTSETFHVVHQFGGSTSVSTFIARDSIGRRGRVSSVFRQHGVESHRATKVDTDVLVVGSGITGCSAAFRLQKLGHKVVLVDSNANIGGNLISKKDGEFQWEEGPNSFQPSEPILQLAKDVGMLSEMVLADAKLPRYIYWQNQLHALPAGILDLIGFELLSWPGKLRAFLGMIGIVSPPTAGEESIHQFVERHFGSEVSTRICDPFVSGVFAGDPRKLSISAALPSVYTLEHKGFTRSLLEGAVLKSSESAGQKSHSSDLPTIPKGSLGSFRRGLQSFAERIAQRVADRDCEALLLGHTLQRIERDGPKYLCSLQSGGAEHTVAAKAVLLTSSASATADVFAQSEALAALWPASERLREIRYPSVASVTIAYPDSLLSRPLRGFGHLIPRSMGVRTLGSIWGSSLFPGRAPAGYSVITSFIGGAQDAMMSAMPRERIAEVVDADVRKVLRMPSSPPLVLSGEQDSDSTARPRLLGLRLWKQAIPQYEVGHASRVKPVLDALRTEAPGLFLGGNFVHGVSLGDCVLRAQGVAADIDRFLGSRR